MTSHNTQKSSAATQLSIWRRAFLHHGRAYTSGEKYSLSNLALKPSDCSHSRRRPVTCLDASFRTNKGISNFADTMATEAETSCPSWYLEGQDSDRKFSQQPARLIRVFDGHQNLPALLLSSELAGAITNGICRGRECKALEKTFETQLAEIEDRLDDATGRLSSVEKILEQENRRIGRSDVAISEDEEKRLAQLYKRQRRAKRDIETAESDTKALRDCDDSASRVWHDRRKRVMPWWTNSGWTQAS